MIDWITAASSREIIAFALFKKDGCPSCGHGVMPWCACWATRWVKNYQARAARLELLDGETKDA